MLGALALALLVEAGPAFSQTEPASLRIMRVDYGLFPEVRLQVAALDSAADPVDVLASSFAVSEDGVPFPISSVGQSDVGVRLVFVAEPGDGWRPTGIRFATTVSTALDNIQWYVAGRPWIAPGIDEVAVIMQEGNDSNVLVPLTTDGTSALERIQGYTVPAEYRDAPAHGYYTRAALMRALDEIEFAPSGQDKMAAIVLFSPGSLADYADVAERALGLGVPIYVVLVRTPGTMAYTDYWSQALSPLATAAMGEFMATSQISGMEALFNDVISLRRQSVVVYRSASASSGTRQVNLDLTTSAGVLSATTQYAVTVAAPQVSILTPGPGTVITRLDLGGSSPPEEAVPNFVTVVAQVIWPDGVPRTIRAARLMVNDLPVGQPRVTEAGAEITWDIRDYQAEAQVPATLIVQIEDELGLQAVSAPVTVAVEFKPIGIGPIGNILTYISIFVALLALGMAVFLFINRQKLAPVLHQASEGIVDFVERVTGRRSSLVARAYLVPVEGFEEPQTKSYEIYGTTAVGRSRRHADLLFHINEEDSPISRLHCTILDEDDHFAIRDEDSSNGTYLNGEKLTPLSAVVLQDGDTIDVAPLERGGLRFLFQVASVDGSQPEDEDELRNTRPRGRQRAGGGGNGADEP